MPQGRDKQYNAVNMHYNLGLALFYNENFKQSAVHLYEAVRLDPNNPKLHYNLASALAAQGNINDTIKHYFKALSLKPDIDKSATLHDLLAVNYARQGNFRQAIVSARKALNLAYAAGKQRLAGEIEQRIILYMQNKVPQSRVTTKPTLDLR
ncbi:MAG: tetratricopeptide repeat protein, partial [Planctomycetota bacterium]|jgi:Flp pilus assembly protein TadD